jgi:anti-sigma factor RsiW
MDHPRTELIPYLRSELPAAEREAVEAHLAGCAMCRVERDAFADLLLDLRRSVPEAPPVDWAGWRAELRARLPRRTRRPWLAPLPLGAAAVAIAAALVLAVWSGVERSASPPPDLVAFDVDRVEPLAAELPDDLDLIVQLDRLTGDGG